MTTLLERRQLGSARLGYLLVIEGCSLVFTDIVSLAGSAYMTDGRTILSGLDLPASLTVGINPRVGLLMENSAAFKVLDNQAGDVSSLFRGLFDDDKSYRLKQRITPSDVTLGSPTLDTFTGTVNPASKHVGIEKIASDRTRRDWYIHPVGGATPFDHPWVENEWTGDVAPLEMTDEIRVWAGRHVALHELVYDEEAGDWSTWNNQYTNCSLIWRGTMQGRGRIIGTAQYEIVCDGPASLTRRQLNRKRPTRSFVIDPSISVGASKKGIAVVPHRRNYQDATDTANNTNYEGSVFDADYDLTATDLQSLKDEISDLFDDVESGVNNNYGGSGGTAGKHFEEDDLGNSLIASGIGALGVALDASNNAAIMGRVSVCMHHAWWAMLGYDPEVQRALPLTDTRYAAFKIFDHSSTDLGFLWADQRDESATDLDYEGYWVLEVQTYNQAVNPGNEAHNNGIPVTVAPIWGGGTLSLDPVGKQEISLGPDPIYIEGQNAFPPGGTYPSADDRPAINSNTVNSMGWFLLEGQLARSATQFGDTEFEDFAQVARCSWYDSGNGIMGTNGSGNAGLVIECLEDPRAFGLPHRKITAPWVAGGTNPMTATPLAVFAHHGHLNPNTQPDAAYRLITRILLSSGTAGAWGTTGEPTYPPLGDNQPAVGGIEDTASSDTEIADLGLGIEDVAVDLLSFRALHLATLGDDSNPLGYVKHAYIGPVNAEDILGDLLEARGWSFGWIRTPGYVQPKWTGVDLYAGFSPSDLPTIGGELFHVTEADIAGDVDNVNSWIPKVKQTWRSPLDAFEVSTRGSLRERSNAYSQTFIAIDAGSNTRTGSATISPSDAGLSDPSLFDGNEGDWKWTDAFRRRWLGTIGPFMGLPNREVTITVSAPKGQWLYPGQGFLLTNPAINSLDGQSIGVAKAQCRVIQNTKILRGKLKGSHRVTALMIGIDTTDGFAKLWAGSAHATSYTDDGGGVYTLTCEEDWTGSGHGGNDVLAFEEPDWSTSGGTAYVRIYQSFDLETFPTANVVLATVDSVTEGSDQMQISSLTGTLYRDTMKIVTLAPYTDQDAGSWVRELVMYQTDSTGSTHTSGVAGKKLG